MSIVKRIGKHGFLYSATGFLQKGVSFFLLPLYTHFLTPNDYGILSVVTSLNGFLSLLIMLSLHGAVSRYYFEYKDTPKELARFWGTLVTFVGSLGFFISFFLLTVGAVLLKPLLGNIAFWPYIALGISTLMFQPLCQMVTVMLQTQEKSKWVSLYTFSQFLVTLLLTISFVVLLKWDASGPLTATLCMQILAFIVAFVYLSKTIKWGIHWPYLKEALSYSGPLIPHSVAGHLLVFSDRLIINRLLNAAATGLFNISYMFGSIVSIFADSINQAYVPVMMDTYKKNNPAELHQLKKMAEVILGFYCVLGCGIAFFSKELILLMTTRSFFESAIYVPIIVFNYVLTGLYYLWVNPLFFDKSGVKYIPVATGIGAALNIGLNIVLILKWGLIGAAFASLSAQLLTVFVVIFLSKKIDLINWNYFKMIALALLSFAFSLGFSQFTLTMPLAPGLGIKLVLFSIFTLSVGYWTVGSRFIVFLKQIPSLRKPKDLIDLLRDTSA